jgi:hypothetical protein
MTRMLPAILSRPDWSPALRGVQIGFNSLVHHEIPGVLNPIFEESGSRAVA